MMRTFLPTQFVTFHVYRPSSQRSPMGRVMWGQWDTLGSRRGILAQASTAEKERWRQLTHPVSHKVIFQGAFDFELCVGDILQGSGVELVLSAIPYNIGGFGDWFILYCHQRLDLNMEDLYGTTTHNHGTQ